MWNLNILSIRKYLINGAGEIASLFDSNGVLLRDSNGNSLEEYRP